MVVAVAAGRDGGVAARRAMASATVMAATTSPWGAVFSSGSAREVGSSEIAGDFLSRENILVKPANPSDASSRPNMALVMASAMSTMNTTPMPIAVTIRPSISVSESDVAIYPSAPGDPNVGSRFKILLRHAKASQRRMISVGGA